MALVAVQTPRQARLLVLYVALRAACAEWETLKCACGVHTKLMQVVLTSSASTHSCVYDCMHHVSENALNPVHFESGQQLAATRTPALTHYILLSSEQCPTCKCWRCRWSRSHELARRQKAQPAGATSSTCFTSTSPTTWRTTARRMRCGAVAELAPFPCVLGCYPCDSAA